MTANRPLAAALLLLSSCAAVEADLRARHCNRDGAFEAGVNDALAWQPMDGTRLVAPCLSAERDAAMAGYREGYLSALASRPAPAGPGAFVCEVSGFKGKYTAFGGSSEEARHKVLEACGRKEEGSVACSNPSCRRAQ